MVESADNPFLIFFYATFHVIMSIFRIVASPAYAAFVGYKLIQCAICGMITLYFVSATKVNGNICVTLETLSKAEIRLKCEMYGDNVMVLVWT